MNTFKHLVASCLACMLVWSGCKTTHVASSPETEFHTPEPVAYRPANTRLHDILHHELRVRFDWKRRYMFGTSTMLIRPYFYPTDMLYLDARGMQINDIALVRDEGRQALEYLYENDSLKIRLDRRYARTDTFTLFIDYVAKPDELKDPGGSAAITSDKGLYFINPDGSDPHKPRQLWTQCETQAGSVWFPTIDSPNERFTQEIYMTVDTSFVTLSNGRLVTSVVNERQGNRTDYWSQSLPAAPYLTMMAVGGFSVVRDDWRGMEVSYYVDPEYEAYARNIFGNTPEMLDFFSGLLGVDYPWEKYAQVVVHDYVSGAMENTSAAVFGSFMQRDPRALLDETYEDVVSHELFHQWFGDLVTCESWSNIALNESFATYGEYLWNEHKYGIEVADYYSMRDLNAYLRQAKIRNAPLIRFQYEEQEEVFDRISYQKGGRILHMLRSMVGDDAFFAGLNLYLDQNRFRSVEAHHLRLAMEEATGQDLNWFFNQWFFSEGHPVLDIAYDYIDSLQVQVVTIDQRQDFETNPLFRIPMRIDLYSESGVESHDVVCHRAREVFLFDAPVRPALVNVDAGKSLICTKSDHKQEDEWVYQYHHGPLFLDRYEALKGIGRHYAPHTPAAATMTAALDDPMWAIRKLAVGYMGTLATEADYKEQVKSRLVAMAGQDPRSAVRVEALRALAMHYSGDDLMSQYLESVNDSSYDVMQQALTIIYGLDVDQGASMAEKLENSANKHIRKIIFNLYAEYGKDANHAFMDTVLASFSGGGLYSATLQYAQFLSRCRPSVIEKGYRKVAFTAEFGDPWLIRMAGIQGLAELARNCRVRASENQADSALAGAYTKLHEKISRTMERIRESETNEKLRRMYGSGGH